MEIDNIQFGYNAWSAQARHPHAIKYYYMLGTALYDAGFFGTL